MVTNIQELRDFRLKNKKVEIVECKCENCGKEYSLKNKSINANLNKKKLLCRGCGISYTKLNKSLEEKEKEQKKREETNLKRYGCKTKLTTPESREALSKVDWNVRNQKTIETKTKNGTLHNKGGMGLKDPKVWEKTRESLRKNKGVDSYLLILGKQRSLETYDALKKEVEEYSELLNDRDSFKRLEKGKAVPLRLKCKKCGLEYSGAFMSERKRCPKCYPEDWPSASSSRGENIIRELLKKNGVIFESQKTFDDLYGDGHKRKLRFDFYLPEYNLCIEYQGNFHFKPANNSPESLAAFEKGKRYDQKKKDYCKQKGIDLLEVFSYEEAKRLLENTFFETHKK